MPRILLVEDEQVNREMFRRRLTARGFDVLTADSGERAVELAKAERPDLVLMDLGLPGIDGWEAVRRVKADPATAAIPVIALSAHATADAKEKALAAGCSEFETKPVQWDSLIRKVNEALAAKPPAPPDDPEPQPAAPDRGTQTIPHPGARVSRPPPAEPGHEAGPAQKKRVLVVEDNDANRAMLCRRLDKQGFVAVEARDGREALDRVREYRFDLVLLDIMMPEVDGYQVLQAIKSDDDLKALPVIMISAVDEMASVVRCIEAGAEDYLTKPYDPVLLQARINACLDKRRLRDQELAYLRAVSDLTKAAAQVERGEFDPAVLAAVAARDDALGTLARVFGRMAREVQARVRQLKEEVERLRVMVEIDPNKKDEELAAVNRRIDTLGLEEKAEAIRAARDRRRAARSPDPRAETMLGIKPPGPGAADTPDAS
jgi:CheY-like chemotaxis protein